MSKQSALELVSVAHPKHAELVTAVAERKVQLDDATTQAGLVAEELKAKQTLADQAQARLTEVQTDFTALEEQRANVDSALSKALCAVGLYESAERFLSNGTPKDDEVGHRLQAQAETFEQEARDIIAPPMAPPLPKEAENPPAAPPVA